MYNAPDEKDAIWIQNSKGKRITPDLCCVNGGKLEGTEWLLASVDQNIMVQVCLPKEDV